VHYVGQSDGRYEHAFGASNILEDGADRGMRVGGVRGDVTAARLLSLLLCL
jgi:hypothetical protein